MKKIYITYEIPDSQLLALEDRYEVIMNNSKQVMSKKSLIDVLGDVDAVIAMYDNEFDREVIDNMKNIKIIASYGAGYNNIDYEYAAKRGVVVSNTPDVLTDVTANLAFGLLMSTARRITESDKCVRNGGFKGWTPEWFVGQEITGKTIGIIGAGKIGSCMAKRTIGFDMKILYHNRKRNKQLEVDTGASFVSKEELLKEADFVSLHVPLTDETYHFISEDEFKMMKNSSIIINASRGQVVDEKALVKSLKNGYIWGAGLDVFENEPEVEPELLEMNNVVMSAHIGGSTIDTVENMTRICLENIIAVLEGNNAPNKVN